MHRNAAYMRVYWGGAFIALGWDLALRKRGSSLDAALRHLRACCMQPPRMWTADELVAELDRWAGEALFSRIAEPILEREAWPSEALEAAYQELGLSVEGETLTLGGGPEARRLRGAITGEEESR